jgi:hypothetical protein
MIEVKPLHGGTAILRGSFIARFRIVPMLSRRSALLAFGAFSLPAGGGHMLSRGVDDGPVSSAPRSPRDPATLEELVHHATLAADSQNARAWRFRQESGGVATYPDATSALPVADAHHLNQPVEVASTRPQLQSLPGLRDGRADMVLRFGHAPARPRSLRCSVVAVIDA